MSFDELLSSRNITKYKLSKDSGVPKTTILDICSNRSELDKCSAKTVRMLANALDLTMEELLDLVANSYKDGKPINKEYLEANLPKILTDAIKKIKKSWKLKENGKKSTWDSDYCELQSDINICETGNVISSEQAWYLREKYLGLSRNRR